MKHYYHINHNHYECGDIIKPGSMGEFINQYTLYGRDNENGMLWRLFQEQTFELIRVQNYKEKPSRMTSIFLFENMEETSKFIKKDQREGTFIYEVEILCNENNIHKASMKLYERIPQGRPVLMALKEQAHQYWCGINNFDPESDFCPELIVESSVLVKSKKECCV